MLVCPCWFVLHSHLCVLSTGIKAVVYTDAFQCFMMVLGQIIVIAVGISKLDSRSDVWDKCWDWERIQVSSVHIYGF